jgi:hypothetical protein
MGRAWHLGLLVISILSVGCGRVDEVESRDPDASAISCDPNEFLECATDDIARVCGPTGQTVRDVACDFGCSAAQRGCLACLSGAKVCAGASIGTCGNDGEIEEETSCALGCVDESDGPRCRVVEPSNLGGGFCEDRTNNNEPIADDINTDAGCDRVVAQGDGAPNICVLIRDEAVVADADIRVTGSRALAIVGTVSLEIQGRIDASAIGRDSGPAAPISTGNGGQTSSSEAGFGGGGAGHGSQGANGSSPDDDGGGGLGGAEFGTEAIQPLIGGARGGAGTSGSPFGVASVPDAPGGGGGGAVQLVSCGELIIGDDAFVHVGGGGGAGGETTDLERDGGGGGGGSGGAILIEALDLTLSGILAANGGSGGAGGCRSPGTDGADATPSDEPAVGSPESLCQGNIGVGGSGGALLAGPEEGGRSSDERGAAGGGGGAVGRIRINLAPGASPSLEGGIVSPEATRGVVGAN